MDSDFVEPRLEELQKPVEWIPDWFKLSPSMLTYNYDSCGQKFIYKYMHRMSSVDNTPSLSRTMAFRHAIFTFQNYMNPNITKSDAILHAVQDYFGSIAKTQAEKLGLVCDTDAILEGYYTWNKKIPSLQVLIDQCHFAADAALKEMVAYNPMQDPQMKGQAPMVNRYLLSELMYDGEVYDETFNRPTQLGLTLQYVSDCSEIILLKMSDKKMYTPNMACYISDEPALMAAALQQYLMKIGSGKVDSFEVIILRAVVNNGGGCTTLEEHRRTIENSDMRDVLLKSADAAKDIKSVRLHKKPQFGCAWCDVKDPCLFGKVKGFQIPVSEALYDRDTDGKFDDDDDLPY
jgi:hypothetical protein